MPSNAWTARQALTVIIASRFDGDDAQARRALVKDDRKRWQRWMTEVTTLSQPFADHIAKLTGFDAEWIRTGRGNPFPARDDARLEIAVAVYRRAMELPAHRRLGLLELAETLLSPARKDPRPLPGHRDYGAVASGTALVPTYSDDGASDVLEIWRRQADGRMDTTRIHEPTRVAAFRAIWTGRKR